jgi:hypothetical protein
MDKNNTTNIDITTPVVIINPEDGHRSKTKDVLVTGVGPLNAQIEIYLDGELVGSTFSNAFGKWSLVVSLPNQQQSLVARACTSAACSEFSNSIKIYREFENSEISNCNLKVGLIKYRFTDMQSKKGLDLRINISDNSDDSHDVTIDWGNTVVDHLSLENNSIKIHQIYKSTGNYIGTVLVKNQLGCEDKAYFSVHVINRSQNGNNLYLVLLVILLIISYRYYLKQQNH